MNAQDAADPDVHIAGMVVHANPRAMPRVARAVRAIAGAEIHGEGRDGKLVVTIECTGEDAIAAALVRIQLLDGVLAAALVYQHSESASDMDAEVDLEDHAPNLR